MYIQKVFEFYDISNSTGLYLHAPDRADSDSILNLYLTWYNEEYAPEEKLPLHKKSDFKFIKSFCPIDFTEEYNQKFKVYD